MGFLPSGYLINARNPLAGAIRTETGIEFPSERGWMRHRGRAVALGAVCAGALWLAAAPASALTLTVAGSTVGASLSVGNGPLQVGVQAPPASIDVQVDPTTGVQASVKAPPAPPLHVAVRPPTLSALAPITSSAPPAALTPASPTPAPTANAPAPEPSASPIVSQPVVSDQPPIGGPAGTADRAGHGAGIATSTRPTDAIRHDAVGANSTNVTAAIASGSDSGLLSALESNNARLLLWFALAGFVIAMRGFVGAATSKDARAS
jgi:hypothetical protein